MSRTSEQFISVDIETSGPIPGEYSMLMLGACVVDDVNTTFDVALRPLNQNFDPEAMAATGLAMDRFNEEGIAPAAAMGEFCEWVMRVCGDRTPVFVGLNAAFDWSFVNYYFHKFLGNNPFGFSALDIKALYMGYAHVGWGDTKSSSISKRFNLNPVKSHIALEDAIFQAQLFACIRDSIVDKSPAQPHSS